VSHSEETPLELQIDLALAEYMQKCDAGQAPDRDAFLALHPELREHLRELLTAADWIEKLAGPRLADVATQARTAFNQASSPDAQSTLDETLPQGLQFITRTHQLHETLPQGSTGRSVEFSVDQLSSGPELSQPALPCRFGDYVLERILGRGGMGVVYFGRQVQLERPVAIKMIRSGALASQEEVLRFYAEARSAARLDHPNIVTVYQCGECDGHHYFSMDFVDGTDLSKLAQAAPLDCKLAARYVRDAARAIQYAHERGILHRDLKPANVLIDKCDQVHITDFGLAKTVGTETGLTASGAALGTPSYMSPEQAAGRLAEQHHATDIYSLGAVLFTIVTGQPPFKGNGIVQTIMHVIHRPAPLAGSVRADLPEDLETIIDVCLQKSPERRYSSAAALADDLHRFLHGMPIQARAASRLRRAWYWVLGIPVIGAVLDHRVVEPTDAHRWVQRGLISVALLCVMMWIITLIPASSWMTNRLPKSVRIAGGAAGGNYAQLAEAISSALAAQSDCQFQAIRTFGSSDNAELLQQHSVDLALLQSDTLGLPGIAVVAPLYYEAVHILVNSKLPATSLADLRQRRVMLGSEKSGARAVASLLFRRAGMTFEDVIIDQDEWHKLIAEPSADACIVVTKKGASDLVALLATGNYRLLPVADSLQFALDEPIFHPVLLDEDSYPNCNLPPEGIASVATTAFLACRVDAPPILIQTVLENLFLPEFVRDNGIQAAEWASRWPGSTWHPAAREFFQAYHGSPVQHH
jgi:TRAP-type uncharacterized transport system substrate-binding protein